MNGQGMQKAQNSRYTMKHRNSAFLLLYPPSNLEVIKPPMMAPRQGAVIIVAEKVSFTYSGSALSTTIPYYTAQNCNATSTNITLVIASTESIYEGFFNRFQTMRDTGRACSSSMASVCLSLM